MSIRTNKNEYTEGNGCHNCKHCFFWSDYDSWPEYYCNIEKDRPKCGSVSMKEKFEFKKLPNGEYETPDEMTFWDEWSGKNEIKPWGICKKWEEG